VRLLNSRGGAGAYKDCFLKKGVFQHRASSHSKAAAKPGCVFAVLAVVGHGSGRSPKTSLLNGVNPCVDVVTHLLSLLPRHSYKCGCIPMGPMRCHEGPMIW